MNIYKEDLLDHYKNPRNCRTMLEPDINSGEYNPACGDRVEIQAKINGQFVKEVSFTGNGCVVSLATASKLTEVCINKSLNEILNFDDNFVISLIGINLGPTRIKCALLSLQALKKGIDKLNSKHGL